MTLPECRRDWMFLGLRKSSTASMIGILKENSPAAFAIYKEEIDALMAEVAGSGRDAAAADPPGAGFRKSGVHGLCVKSYAGSGALLVRNRQDLNQMPVAAVSDGPGMMSETACESRTETPLRNL